MVLVWQPIMGRVYHLKPLDLLDLTPLQLLAFEDDNPQPVM